MARWPFIVAATVLGCAVAAVATVWGAVRRPWYR
jgi:hypothetical protein